jgi:hypothetical protein
MYRHFVNLFLLLRFLKTTILGVCLLSSIFTLTLFKYSELQEATIKDKLDNVQTYGIWAELPMCVILIKHINIFRNLYPEKKSIVPIDF